MHKILTESGYIKRVAYDVTVWDNVAFRGQERARSTAMPYINDMDTASHLALVARAERNARERAALASFARPSPLQRRPGIVAMLRRIIGV